MLTGTYELTIMLADNVFQSCSVLPGADNIIQAGAGGPGGGPGGPAGGPGGPPEGGAPAGGPGGPNGAPAEAQRSGFGGEKDEQGSERSFQPPTQAGNEAERTLRGREGGGHMSNMVHHIHFYVKDGVQRAVHQTELSKQVADDLYVTDNTVSWKAYAGSEGVDLWQYVLTFTDISDEMCGACFGLPPFFRGYLPLKAKKVAD